MSPEVDAALRTIMVSLLVEIAPDLKSEYRQASAGVLAIAALFMAEEFDRAAAVRAWENGEMRRLLGLGSTLVGDPGLRDRLAAAANGGDTDLRVSALNAANAALRNLLIELQATLEQADGPLRAPARDARRRIVAFLGESARRRSLRLG